MMKTTIYVIVALLIIVLCVCGADNYKMRYCEVVDVIDGVATIEDNRGRLWEWHLEENEQSIEKGQGCRLNMSDNHTEYDRTDDYICSIDWVD